MSRISIPDKQLVVDADEMDSTDFAKHMSYRHQESLGGLRFLSDNLGDYVEGMYRVFHDRLHATRVDLEHEHEDNWDLCSAHHTK